MDTTTFKHYIDTVDDALLKLGIVPKDCRTDEPNKWHLHRGKANVVIFVRESELYNKETRPVLVVVAPIAELPQNNPEQRFQLYDFFLEMNHHLITENFSINENQVYLKTTYFMDELSDNEIATLIDNLSYYAQYFIMELSEHLESLQEAEKEK